MKIKTRTGRTVDLTPIHKLHIFNGRDIIQKPAGGFLGLGIMLWYLEKSISKEKNLILISTIWRIHFVSQMRKQYKEIRKALDSLLETYQLRNSKVFIFHTTFYMDTGKAGINLLLIFYKNWESSLKRLKST